MTLTAIQRIAGGFALQVALLLVLGITAWFSIITLDQRLEQSSNQITPTLVTSSQVSSQLLDANKVVMEHLNETQAERLANARERFALSQSLYQQKKDELAQLTQDDSNIQNLINEADQHSQSFFSLSEQAFNSHEQRLLLKQQEKQAALKLLEALDLLKSDVEELAKFGGTPEERRAGKKMLATLAKSNQQFMQLRESEALADYDKAHQALNKQGDSLDKLNSKLQTLVKDGSQDASFILKSLEPVIQSASQTNGISDLHHRRLQTLQQENQLRQQLVSAVDQAQRPLNALLERAQQQAQIARDESQATVSAGQMLILAICLGSVVIALVTGVIVGRSINRPLHRVMKQLQQISEGDLTGRVSVERNDEFGTLTNWVNQLAKRQGDMLRQIRDAAGELNDTAHSSAEASQRSHSNLHDQQQSTDQLASAIHQLSGSVQEIASHTDTAQNSLTELTDQAANSQQQMQRNVELVNRLAENIDQTGNVVNQLHQYCGEIGSILDVIGGIAEQTNLLALNAAIEAARAGEQGRGFAVVADEVRTLASRTQNSTTEIQNMINQLVSGAAKAVDMMDQSRQQARDGANQTADVGQALQDIIEALHKVHDMSLHIASATEQQNAVSNEISGSVQQIAEMAVRINSDATQVSEHSQRLSSLANEQQQQVARFKIS